MLQKVREKNLYHCLETPEHIVWWEDMENKYDEYIPPGRTCNKTPVRFFRKNQSIMDFIELLKQPFHPVRDESKDVNPVKPELINS